MLDDTAPSTTTDGTTSVTNKVASGEGAETQASTKPVRKRAPRKKAPSAEPSANSETGSVVEAEASSQPATKKASARKAPAKKTAAKKGAVNQETANEATGTVESGANDQAVPAKRTKKAKSQTDDGGAVAATKPKRAPKKTATKVVPAEAPGVDEALFAAPVSEPTETNEATAEAAKAPAIIPLFQAPVATTAPRRRTRPAPEPEEPALEDDNDLDAGVEATDDDADADQADSAEATEGGEETGTRRRPRRRGGRRRRKTTDGESGETDESTEAGEDDAEPETDAADGEETTEVGTRRRRRRRRSGDDGGESTQARAGRTIEDEITAVTGSTRLEAKKQRRREGREAGRRRAPIVSEAEFLARRESVDRVMVIRQREELTQIAVLEDRVLVEHYVARESQTSLIGNVYLGRVQNVLPSMEAAFIDIGKGRNAVLYAGEVNWQALGHQEGQPRKIESVLQPGQTVLVQVSKDPIGHKGARLTSQISLPGRFLVYVPDGTTSGISRKLPDTERNRLKNLLKEIVPDTAGVIVRTAAEGASEEELTRDVERLTARWTDIEAKVAAGRAPELLYGEPDLTLKVVRDLFTEDFASLVIQGDDAWDLVDGYVSHVAPDLRERLQRFEPAEGQSTDVFAAYRVDEQIAKGLDRKVWLPSGGSLVIDRTEAMTVVDVNTGKFTGSGGNLEETVTKNNLEAAEEIVRQLRLRDIGGIIVVDFIDMVLESNRDLVLRRMVECLGRDRTRHQVAEVTSLGLVQMTRKRIGTGLLESFSHECDHCKGRGVVVHEAPVEPTPQRDEAPRSRRGRSRTPAAPARPIPPVPSPRDLAAVSRPEVEAADNDEPGSDGPAETTQVEAPETETVRAEQTNAAPELAPVAEEETAEAPAAVEEATGPALVEDTPAPLVVTTRRRGARRPAGPPVISPASAPEPAASTETAEPTAVATPEPTEGAEQPDDDDQTVGGAQTEESDGDAGNGVLHVPIKRKGTRKR